MPTSPAHSILLRECGAHIQSVIYIPTLSGGERLYELEVYHQSPMTSFAREWILLADVSKLPDGIIGGLFTPFDWIRNSEWSLEFYKHIGNAREKNVISPLFLEKEPYIATTYRKWKKNPQYWISKMEKEARTASCPHYALCNALCYKLRSHSEDIMVRTQSPTHWFELKAQLTDRP